MESLGGVIPASWRAALNSTAALVWSAIIWSAKAFTSDDLAFFCASWLDWISNAVAEATLFAKSMASLGALSAASADELMTAAAATARMVLNMTDTFLLLNASQERTTALNCCSGDEYHCPFRTNLALAGCDPVA